MNDDASRIDRSEIKNTGSNRLTNIASSFFHSHTPLYFKIHCCSRCINIINSISLDFHSFTITGRYLLFFRREITNRLNLLPIYIKLVTKISTYVYPRILNFPNIGLGYRMPLPLPRKPQSPIYQLQLQLQASTRVDIRRKHSRPLTHPPTRHSIEDSIEETYARRQRQQPVNRPDSTRLISMGRSWPQIDRSPCLPACLPPSSLFADRNAKIREPSAWRSVPRRRAYRTRRKSTLGPLN